MPLRPLHRLPAFLRRRNLYLLLLGLLLALNGQSLWARFGAPYFISDPGAIGVSGETRLEAAFSPDSGARDLVLRFIDSAQQSLQVMAFSFSSREITSALIKAHKRGVKVTMIVDYKANFEQKGEGRREGGNQALERCRKAGITVRALKAFAIAHDKLMIADARSVQTGSFNYSHAAAVRNSENVLVVWNNPQLAARYNQLWQRNWALATAVDG